MKDIKESEQASQGFTIGTQGNQGGVMPEGDKGTHHKQPAKDDRHIPNQERSSATNKERQDK